MSTNLGLPILIYKWKRISSPRFIGPCLHTAYPCCSVTMSCLTLCIPKNFSTPGFPVLHYLPEFAQTHVHWVSNIIQPSDPLSAPSPLALNLSQHQGLFQWVSSSQQVAKVLELQLSALVLPMNIQDGFPLGLTGLIFLQSKGLSRIFSSTTIWKHQFFGALPSWWSHSHPHMNDYWKNHSFG